MLSLFSSFVDGLFTIKDFPQENMRKLNKIKIFLNGKKDIKYHIDSTSLVIEFASKDDFVITQQIENVINSISHIYECEIILDKLTLDKIKNANNILEEINETSSDLRKIKNSNINSDSAFMEYCEFCDNNLACKLRPYQYSASYYLSIGKGGFDFSVPGSGKTIISYAAYNYLKNNRFCDHILIIGPINSFNAWKDEYITSFGRQPDFESLANFTKYDAKTYLLSSNNNHKEITFINNDKAWRMKKDIISFLQGKKILLIIDEAHKEKNPSAEITKAVLEISKYAYSRILLTGTPMPNGYEDLYTLFEIFSPYKKILPCSYGELKKLTKNGASDEEILKIMDSIRPFYSRVSKKYLLETGELLPPNSTYIKCAMNEDQKIIYAFLDEMACNIDNDFESVLNISLMKAILIRKMQVSANPGLLSKSIISSIDEYHNEYASEFLIDDSENEQLIKADKRLKELLANSKIASIVAKYEGNFLETNKNKAAVDLALKICSSGYKVIIWDVFVQNMNTLKHLLKNKTSLKIEIINGTVNGQERQNALDNFKNGDCQILIANPATLAESVSLHRCCQNAIYVNRNFNAAQFIQSKERIHRINMPKNTTANYFFLYNEDTVDCVVNERLKIKEDRMLKILDNESISIGGSEFENDSFMNVEDVIQSFRK